MLHAPRYELPKFWMSLAAVLAVFAFGLIDYEGAHSAVPPHHLWFRLGLLGVTASISCVGIGCVLFTRELRRGYLVPPQPPERMRSERQGRILREIREYDVGPEPDAQPEPQGNES